MFTITDNKYATRSYMFNKIFVQFNNHVASVPPSIAYRISRISEEKEYEIKEQNPVPYDRLTWSEQKRIIWSCNVASASGFGAVTEQVLLSLLKNGVNVQNPGSISSDSIHGGEFVDKRVEASLYQSIEPDCLEIQYCQPPALRLGVVQRSWAYAMFETDHTPVSWIKKLNKLERVLVPSSWLIKSWRDQGLTVPMSVFHHGIDPEQYSYMNRPIDREKYTFLQYGELDIRKGSDLTFKAFADEFKGQDDVQLILKTTRAGIYGVPIEYPNVRIIRSTLSKEEMKKMLFDADCFVFPTRGEGFGLPPLEAMATGLPTIITDWSGPVDYSDPADTFIVSHAMRRAYQFDIIYKQFYDYKNGENAGSWAEPNYEEVRHCMRWCYENRAKAKEKGRKAAERIAREWTWDNVVKNELISLFDREL